MPDFLTSWRALIILLKPRIALSVTLEAIVAMLLARRQMAEIRELFLLSVVLFLSSSGAALANNLLDEKWDLAMKRTSQRAEAIRLWGKEYLWFLAVLLILASLAAAWFFFHWLVAVLILGAALSYVLWYTLRLKRRSPFGAILGGLPGALPVLIGGYAVSMRFAVDIWLFFLFMMFWQPAHFWALALYLKDDYALARLPVMPVVYGEQYTKYFIYMYGASLIPITFMMGYWGGYSLTYFVFALLGGTYYLVQTVRFTYHKQEYKKAFVVSLVYLMWMFLSLFLEVFL
ncbi:MAG: heme o synthase [Leptospiraceae bacterium]|nr:heme o synthase [Leptospiraceae bacterium]